MFHDISVNHRPEDRSTLQRLCPSYASAARSCVVAVSLPNGLKFTRVLQCNYLRPPWQGRVLYDVFRGCKGPSCNTGCSGGYHARIDGVAGWRHFLCFRRCLTRFMYSGSLGRQASEAAHEFAARLETFWQMRMSHEDPTLQAWDHPEECPQTSPLQADTRAMIPVEEIRRATEAVCAADAKIPYNDEVTWPLPLPSSSRSSCLALSRRLSASCSTGSSALFGGLGPIPRVRVVPHPPRVPGVPLLPFKRPCTRRPALRSPPAVSARRPGSATAVHERIHSLSARSSSSAQIAARSSVLPATTTPARLCGSAVDAAASGRKPFRCAAVPWAGRRVSFSIGPTMSGSRSARIFFAVKPQCHRAVPRIACRSTPRPAKRGFTAIHAKISGMRPLSTSRGPRDGGWPVSKRIGKVFLYTDESPSPFCAALCYIQLG